LETKNARQIASAGQDAFLIKRSQEDILEDEQHRQDVHQGGDLLGLAGQRIEHHIGDDAQADALGDGVEQRHGDDGNVGRDGFAQVVVVEADLRDRADHQEAHHDQRRRGGKGGNGGEQRREQGTQQEEKACHQRRQTGTSARADAGGRFHKGRHRGGAQHRADGGADSIGHQGRLDAGQTAFLIQHIGLGGHADQGAEGVEQVNEQEGEDDHDEVQNPDGGEVHTEALAEGLAQLGEVRRHDLAGDQGVEARLGCGGVDAGQLAHNADQPGGNDTQKDRAAHILDVQRGGDQRADQGQQGADAMGGEILGEAGNGDQRGGIHRQTGVLQTNEGDEQADTHGHAPLERQRDGIEDGLAHIGQRQDDEDDAFHKHRQQRDLPAVPKALHHGIGQVGIQTHARRQHKGQIGHKRHAAGADEGRNGRRQQHRRGIHASIRQDAGIHRQDVGHGHEGGDARHDLRFNRRLVL